MLSPRLREAWYWLRDEVNWDAQSLVMFGVLCYIIMLTALSGRMVIGDEC